MSEVGRRVVVTLTVRTGLPLSVLAQRARWMHADAELRADPFVVVTVSAEEERSLPTAKGLPP